jgi:hypothetical protein
MDGTVLRAVILLVVWSVMCGSLAVVAGSEVAFKQLVPDIVHQTYDYQAPNFFLFLSLLCVQRFMKPKHHYLWVMDEGRFRKGQWEGWQRGAKEGSWEAQFVFMLQNKTIEWQYLTFPLHPPNKPELVATNKAHRSDFARMKLLHEMGGVYLDTDAYVIRPLRELYSQEFVIAFDNIVNIDENKPKRMNNGVLLSAPNATFLELWQREYQKFNPASFDHDSSVVPYRLATLYPDLLHVEFSRLSPISYGFQTALLAEAITCGVYLPNTATSNADVFTSLQLHATEGLLWYAQYDHEHKQYSFQKTTKADAAYMHRVLGQKMVLHLTMSQVRGICMMRKNLGGPEDLYTALGPSFIGHLFRLAYFGYDDYYAVYAKTQSPYKKPVNEWTREEYLQQFQTCRSRMGMHMTPDRDDPSRQQYTRIV